jgi:hypothetical protein
MTKKNLHRLHGIRLNKRLTIYGVMSDIDLEGEFYEPHDTDYISASRVQAWLFCPQSHYMKYNQGIPGASNYMARIGTKMHERVANSLLDGTVPRLPRKWLKVYEDFCKKLKLSDNLLVEKEFSGMAQGEKILGYMDVVDLDNLFIIDWKFGKVRDYPVQAYLYVQMIEQSLGAELPMYYAYIKNDHLKLIERNDISMGRKKFEMFINREDRFLPTWNGSKKCLSCSYSLICAGLHCKRPA